MNKTATAFSFRVAAFVWLSDALRRERPQAAQALAVNSSKRLTVGNRLTSMLDVARMSFQELGATMSLFSPLMRQQ